MELPVFMNLIKYFELAAALVGFLYYNKLRGSFWRFFPFFLLTLFLFECLGLWMSENKIHNNDLYKYVVEPFIFFAYSYLFKKILPNNFSKFIYVGFVVYTCSLLAEVTILASLHPYYSSFSLSVINVFFLIYVLKYYIELVKSEQILTFYNQLEFWFCSGVLIFYLGCLPYFSLYNLIVANFYNSIFIPYSWVFVGLNYIMYLLFIVGFIWNKKK